MTRRTLPRCGRRGATAVETAVVLIPLTMFVFGVFEYGRLLMSWNLLNNAAREGCRYALANNTSTSISSDVQQIVTNVMGGQDANFGNFTVTVTGTHNGTATPVNNLVAGDLITVTVSGNYRFMNVIPLVSMPTTSSLSCSVTMVCEGAT
jgi:Flp pilus assembly protein TadG